MAEDPDLRRRQNGVYDAARAGTKTVTVGCYELDVGRGLANLLYGRNPAESKWYEEVYYQWASSYANLYQGTWMTPLTRTSGLSFKLNSATSQVCAIGNSAAMLFTGRMLGGSVSGGSGTEDLQPNYVAGMNVTTGEFTWERPVYDLFEPVGDTTPYVASLHAVGGAFVAVVRYQGLQGSLSPGTWTRAAGIDPETGDVLWRVGNDPMTVTSVHNLLHHPGDPEWTVRSYMDPGVAAGAPWSIANVDMSSWASQESGRIIEFPFARLVESDSSLHAIEFVGLGGSTNTASVKCYELTSDGTMSCRTGLVAIRGASGPWGFLHQNPWISLLSEEGSGLPPGDVENLNKNFIQHAAHQNPDMSETRRNFCIDGNGDAHWINLLRDTPSLAQLRHYECVVSAETGALVTVNQLIYDGQPPSNGAANTWNRGGFYAWLRDRMYTTYWWQNVHGDPSEENENASLSSVSSGTVLEPGLLLGLSVSALKDGPGDFLVGKTGHLLFVLRDGDMKDQVSYQMSSSGTLLSIFRELALTEVGGRHFVLINWPLTHMSRISTFMPLQLRIRSNLNNEYFTLSNLDSTHYYRKPPEELGPEPG